MAISPDLRQLKLALEANGVVVGNNAANIINVATVFCTACATKEAKAIPPEPEAIPQEMHKPRIASNKKKVATK